MTTTDQIANEPISAQARAADVRDLNTESVRYMHRAGYNKPALWVYACSVDLKYVDSSNVVCRVHRWNDKAFWP